jgi:hypothetical protein
MESFTKKLNYYDQAEIGKSAFKGDDLFDFFCTLLMDIISDNELTRFDMKDLISAINDEIQMIQVENIRP